MADVYSPTVIRHFRHPKNRGALATPDISHEGVNPLCGDRLRVQVRLDGDRIAEAGFVGDACAISIAAASLFTEMIRGLPLAEAVRLDEERLVSALQAEIRPGRRGCALLPLRVLQAGVDERSARARPGSIDNGAAPR